MYHKDVFTHNNSVFTDDYLFTFSFCTCVVFLVVAGYHQIFVYCIFCYAVAGYVAITDIQVFFLRWYTFITFHIRHNQAKCIVVTAVCLCMCV